MSKTQVTGEFKPQLRATCAVLKQMGKKKKKMSKAHTQLDSFVSTQALFLAQNHQGLENSKFLMSECAKLQTSIEQAQLKLGFYKAIAEEFEKGSSSINKRGRVEDEFSTTSTSEDDLFSSTSTDTSKEGEHAQPPLKKQKGMEQQQHQEEDFDFIDEFVARMNEEHVLHATS